MGVMTIDHMLFEKGTPATPTHSYMHTYSLSNYPNSIREKKTKHLVLSHSIWILWGLSQIFLDIIFSHLYFFL